MQVGETVGRTIDQGGLFKAPASRDHFDLLELTRFLLSLSIVVFHFFFFGPQFGVIPGTPSDTAVVPYLMFSVNAFFIVSAFVIFYSAAGKSFSRFMVARIARLGPCLLICGTITFCCLYFFPSPPTPEVTFSAFLATIFVVPLAYFPGVDWSLWSLKYEIIFYGLVALFIAGQSQIRWGIDTIVAFAVAIETAMIWQSLTYDGMSYHPLGHYGSAFLLGMLLYIWKAGIGQRRMVLGLMIVCFANLATELWWELNRVKGWLGMPLHERWEGLLLAGAVFGIVVASLQRTTSEALRRIFRLAGMMSYPLYVLHQLLGYWLINQVSTLGLAEPFTVRLGVLVLVVAMSAFIALIIEPPLRRTYSQIGLYLCDRAGRLMPLSPRWAK